MTDEIWAEIADFPGYAVSTEGRVKNLRSHVILRPRSNSYGYLRVALRKDGKTHDVYIHQLVAKTFVTGYRWGTQVTHVNDSEDNSIFNLRFRKGARMGTIRKNLPRPIGRYVRIVETGQLFNSVYQCARFINGDASSIYRVLRGERSTYRGLTFVYEYEET